MKRILLILALALPLGACFEEKPREPSQRDLQAQQSMRAANSIQFSANAERENIQRRLQLTADPGLLGYIILFNESGSPILYETVKGKVTTSGSRLTPPDRINVRPGGQSADSQAVVRAPSDTGTYDTGSATFIYYWNNAGEYRQWSGHYLYSTSPIRTRVEPLVVNIQ